MPAINVHYSTCMFSFELACIFISSNHQNEGVFAYISIKDSHANIFEHVEGSIISFPSTGMVEYGFSAVVDVFSRKRNKLDPNSRGTARLRLNNFIKIDCDILCQRH